ncbi:MAG: acyl-CoA dehydrogenase family protein [Acidimicrobiales bacterium]
MELAFTEEQEELGRTLRRWLDKRSPASEVRRLMEGPLGYDPEVWGEMAGTLGLQGMAIPEAHGGSGFGWVELGVVFEEMGRALCCAPYFATVALAATAILTSGDVEAMAELLPGIASGEVVATLAVTEPDGRPELEAIRTRATRLGDGSWELDGEKCFVVDGQVADTILVVSRSDHGLSLFAVAGDAPGLARQALATMDQTRRQGRLRFSGTPARLVGVEGGADAGLRRTLELAAVALAAEQVGGAQRCLDMAVDYAKVRVQFGRPIGSFQAVKHRLADMMVDIEQARSAAYMAALVAERDWDDPASTELGVVASVAKAYCSDACFHAAEGCIQVLGGIGFTWEHDAHLYFKRAKSSQLALGDPAYHRELLAGLVGM